MKEIPANLPKLKWVILNPEEAKKRHIEVLVVDDEHTLLSIELSYIPCDMSVLEYVEKIVESGIVLQLNPEGKPIEFENH